jgi:hypothetical protein
VHKVFPAMYIENITDLAFDDVPVEDPDFPFIQGCTAVLSPSCTFCEITSVRSCLRATFFCFLILQLQHSSCLPGWLCVF